MKLLLDNCMDLLLYFWYLHWESEQWILKTWIVIPLLILCDKYQLPSRSIISPFWCVECRLLLNKEMCALKNITPSTSSDRGSHQVPLQLHKSIRKTIESAISLTPSYR